MQQRSELLQQGSFVPQHGSVEPQHGLSSLQVLLPDIQALLAEEALLVGFALCRLNLRQRVAGFPVRETMFVRLKPLFDL